MARGVRYHERFKRDVESRVRWLAANRPRQQSRNLRDALAAFKVHIATHPGIGREIELRGSQSYRVFPIGSPLPYLVWYSYDTEDERASVSLLMLLHESQDRDRFSPDEFE